MADKEHLDILKQGVVAWNEWRRTHPKILPDLTNAVIRETDLMSADFNHTNLSHSDLKGSDLISADLNRASLRGADMTAADLRRATLHGADLTEALIIFGNLNRADFTGANLTRAKMNEAHLIRSTFSRADLRDADLTGTKLHKTNLFKANLSRSVLSRASLLRAGLQSAKLTDANICDAELTETDLSKADLSRANLGGARLYRTILRNTILNETDFTDATMRETVIVSVNLSSAMGLETVRHRGPSELSFSTIHLSEGKVPEEFLRGCGLPEVYISQIPSLLTAIQPIQFYSCFISYSGKDERFAKRLHSRMREANLRVWFAPEDMKGGDKLYDQIDRAIQVHDRLLLVLSESSLKSNWVETEIRRARKVELEEDRRKLFPIRLVDYEALQDWACIDSATGEDLAEEVRSYFIPDFTNWKSHDDFEQGFARLLSDLTASA
jgi:uncharacterized protein YjbI with pentapeptide repeats